MQQAIYVAGRRSMLLSSNDFTQQGSRPKTKLGLNRESHDMQLDMLLPSKDGFEKDPLGYGALGWHKWALAQTVAGFSIDLEAGPTSEDLKSPVLWLSHAHAMAEAARVLIQGNPNLDPMPPDIRGVSHCQYHAIALMLVGYSLEICLKAMLIIKKGVATYQAEEKEHRHHRLQELAAFIPGLNSKDEAMGASKNLRLARPW